MRTRILLIALLALPLCGCGRLARPKDFSAELSAWLGKQTYSSWETFRGPDGQLPHRPDGLTLGNREIFAGIGCDDKDLSQIGPLYGDRKSVRALSSPLKFSLEIDGRSVPLADLERQRLRRIRGTSIAVGSSEGREVSATTVDFAPLLNLEGSRTQLPSLPTKTDGMKASPPPGRGRDRVGVTPPTSILPHKGGGNPIAAADRETRDPNLLVRLVVVSNQGKSADYNLVLSGLMGEVQQKRRGYVVLGGRMGILSDYPLQVAENEGRPRVRLPLGRINKGEKRSVSLFFLPAADTEKMDAAAKEDEEFLAHPLLLLEATVKGWRSWRSQVKVASGDARLDDLIDSLLCLVKSHVGYDAIHTGSLRYPHTRAWTRDDYWVQRALLEAGLKEEAKLNLAFFFSAWKKSGLRSYYEIATRRGEAYGDLKVELPHYFVLMVKDAEKMAGVDGRRYWPMVKDCLDKAGVPENGLQPINGDETWLLAAGINQLDYVLDNSLLLIASAEYGSDLARRMGDNAAAEKYATMAKKGRQGIQTKLHGSVPIRFLIGRSGPDEAGLDQFPASGPLARTVIFGTYTATSPGIVFDIIQAWESLSYPEGLRAYSRSSVVDGGTPGYFLYATSEAGLGESRALVKRVIDGFCSSTGNVWELESVTDPKWGLEKRRLWDSAVLLMGLLKYSQLRQSLPKAPPEIAPIASLKIYDAYMSQLSKMLDGWLGFSKGCVILEKDSPAYARELATQLARHYAKPASVGESAGKIPAGVNVIIISSTPPAGFKEAGTLNYAMREEIVGAGLQPARNGQIAKHRAVIWVRNRGDVFADLRGLEYDLFRSAVPQRKPAPFPESDLDLAAAIGEKPTEALSVKVSSDTPISISCGSQTKEGKEAAFSLRPGEVAGGAAPLQISAGLEKERIVALTVFARGGPDALAKVEVAFPAGFWVVEARNLKGGWDRTTDPIDEIHRPDGSRVFVFQVRLGPGAQKSFTLRLARPAILKYGGNETTDSRG